MKFSFQALILVGAMSLGLAALGDDYVDAVPPTVYEASAVSPQNADYGAANNMFIAHPGWYNSKAIQYYKFRIYAPGTYPGVISGPPDMSTAADVPVQDIHFTTTTGDFSGVVGTPIIENHHTDAGDEYSDFMRVNFVTVPADYAADTLKSVGDVLDQGFTPVPTDIVLNMPVVPTGAVLQHPGTKGTTIAPIDPFMVYFKGQMVTTYVFEVTDQSAKDYLNPLTRSTEDADFAITVAPFNISGNQVYSIPLWHVNQYSRGVTPGEGGGPSPDGMRNIINLDRADPGYSPLWQIYWLTEMPIDYSANQVSDSSDMTAANGFVWATAPMFVNCPNIGAVGTQDNPLQVDSFNTVIDTRKESNWILGSHMSLIFQADEEIVFKAGAATAVTTRSNHDLDATIATIKTNEMGAFEYELMTSDIPTGTSVISVMANGNVIQEIPVNDLIAETPDTVYESADMSPQNMDFDKDNNLFPAHAGWYKDKLIHYYKFRIFAPSTYPGRISGPPNMSSSSDVPLQNIYLMTTTGNWQGVTGMPVIEYHHVDGNLYSDFMIVNFVTVPSDYAADTFKTVADIKNSGNTITTTDTVLNLPVVPSGSTLQLPGATDATKASITETKVFYRGVEVWTYIFEVTSEEAKDFFADTRDDPDDTDFAITVTEFASPTVVSAIPLFHVNQFSRGVDETNFGGPSDTGMRNIINLDRGDAGYSPLWQIFWLTEVPINYSADQVSHSDDFGDGFEYAVTPMFVNCPDIGSVGAENSNRAEDFDLTIDPSKESNHIIGSHMSLIFQEDVSVMLKAGDQVIATTQTDVMGAYAFELRSSDIPEGAEELTVVTDGQTIRTISIVGADGTSSAVVAHGFLVAVFACVVAAIAI